MLRHDNSSFFSAMDLRPALMVQHSGNITDPTAFAQVLAKTLDKIATRASNGTGKKFAVEEVIMTSLRRLYTLAQCTPDLTALDCNSCLRAMISNLPKGRKGGRSFTLSCSVRFEEYPFYNAPAPPPSYLPPSPAPTSAAPEIRPKGAKELTAVESLQFDLATIQVATNYFSHENKLGEGGFGEVFQGRLPNGQQVAVKRLSQRSKQGDGEFKNEILLVAKLQHINLVRLLGFCLEGEEKLLVYEFVPNKSLDYFLFDPQKRRQLDWPLRYKIIFGIARGMLYLHEDSRLRIIHRDLKCSNILLDSEINPKISDFGMARIFGVNQTQASTNKIVGTFGYMSPEYAMHGEFSVKSDVYSFGILLLEIICGKKNNLYQDEYLAGYAWNQWRDGTPLKVLDPAIVDSNSRDQVLRCLHICLLCIQEDPAIRPTMTTVVLLLSNNSITPPSPQHPAFFVQMKGLESDQSTRRTMPLSINGVSLTELCPR
ncbi:hypothetical protein EUGRSUZ_H04149 [Eucalyptus grandis]|uniref:Uncharacterized protein n=2 Tax=Eucalyptus grandis TaxID=71139 RepID=A0ACC3JVS1_EUCGR|nr:hypothetical protein EUGRSUZ_H04149 [Eucalyptus grandis]